MAGDQFQVVFDRLQNILKPYEPQLTITGDQAGEYSLDAGYAEQFKRNLFFGSAKIQKNYVSYYLMPVYVFPELLDDISTQLRKRMQGKSCFNFKRVDEDLFTELARLTERGFERYAERGWIQAP